MARLPVEAKAVLAVITFAGHLLSLMWTDIMWWLPEIVWAVAIVFSILAIYSGIITATRPDPNKRGTAIASAVIGSIVLFALLISGVSWLFATKNGYETLTSLM